MSPHRDQEGGAIRHAVYQPVCTCNWRGFSGCVVHPSLSERDTAGSWQSQPRDPSKAGEIGRPSSRSESDEMTWHDAAHAMRAEYQPEYLGHPNCEQCNAALAEGPRR